MTRANTIDRAIYPLRRVAADRRAIPLFGAALLAVGLWAAGAQWQAWNALNDPRPPLLSLPAGGAGQSSTPPTRQVRRLYFLIADGLLPEVAWKLPQLSALASKGLTATSEVRGPTFSTPSYVAWIAGVDPTDSGVRTNRFQTALPLDSLIVRARRAGLTTVSFAEGHDAQHPSPLTTLFGHHIKKRIAGKTPWSKVLETARRADLAVLVLEEVDHAGHRYGAADPRYREAARRIDRRIGELARIVDFDRDLLVVVNDHGHLQRGGHGGDEPAERSLFLIARGRGFGVGGQRRRIDQRDLAPTLAMLLGLTPPAHGRGWPMAWAVAGVDAGYREAAFGAHLLVRWRLEHHLATHYETSIPAMRQGTPTPQGLMRIKTGNLREARRLGRHLVGKLAAGVDRAQQQLLRDERSYRAVTHALIALALLLALSLGVRIGLVQTDTAGWLLSSLSLGVGLGVHHFLGLKVSLSINGPLWMVRFVGAALAGAVAYLLLCRIWPNSRGGGRIYPGRLVSGIVLAALVALAVTAAAPVVSGAALPDLRLVAAAFLTRAWFISFTVAAGLVLVLFGKRMTGAFDATAH